MNKKPLTSEQFFNIICKQLEKQNKLPNILDYHLADDRNKIELTNYEFDFTNNLNYGGSEGIYLDIGINFRKPDSNKYQNYHIGTFKTLNEDDESFRKMAILLADFIIYAYDYVNTNINDFDFEK